jgi:ATP-dependent exoDNAse (exonuclease V) beta subunit
MKQTLHNILSVKNAHPRDKYIEFFEKGHKYVISFEPDVIYTSVTTWNHSHFEKFDADKIIENMMKSKGWKEGHKYWGLTPEQIKEQWNTNGNKVAEAGTDLHYNIECFNNNNSLQTPYYNKDLYEAYMYENIEEHDTKPLEWKYFINFVKDFPHLKPYRTEWLIYDEDVKISGSIDMVYENTDGTLSIYDWKRSKNITRINNFNKFALPEEICHLPDSNFWHYALQLNTYKIILERKYEKKIKDLYLVRLHPDTEENNYDLIQLPNLSKEIVELFIERKNKL